MKWFFGLVLILNLLVAGYGALKVRAPQDIHAQEVSPAMLKVLPAGWKPPVDASLPVVAMASEPAAVASAPVAASSPVAGRKPAASASAPEAKAVVTPVVKAAPHAAVASAPAKRVMSCRQWGPLSDTLLARVKGGVPALHLTSSQVSENAAQTHSGSGKFWVYYPPLTTRAETLTLSSELKSKGFDNYLVSRDDHKGAVSLGLFGKEDTARALMAKVRAAGYDKVAMAPRETTVMATTLRFADLDGSATTRLEALQKRLTPGIRLAPCAQ